jgi:hypothetical protein
MYFSDYTTDEKIDISKQLKERLDDKTAHKDYHKFANAVTTDLDAIKPLSPVGLTFLENYVHVELLNTKSKQGISFYDFWANRDFYMTRDKSTKNLVASIQKNKPYLTEIKVAKQVFNLYYGGISMFRPTMAARLYAKYSPKVAVLDFTMGWGGRLMGAVAMNLPKYIGIDYNTNLEEPYQKMKAFLQDQESGQTIIDLYFQDALTMDYSKLDYDMVFTSPPYYNKEIYGGKDTYKTQDEWDEKFYIPIIQETWKYLKPGGTYCLNVPAQLYERVCVPILGHAQELMELNKYQRILPKQKENAKQTNVGQKYKEYIYVWIKEGVHGEPPVKKLI